MGAALWPTELSRRSWPPRNRTAHYLCIGQAPSTSWVVASGRRRCRSPRCYPARAFKARCRSRRRTFQEQRAEVPTPTASRRPAVFETEPATWQVHSPCGRRRTRISGPSCPHPLSRRGPPPGDFISHGRRAENSNPTVSPAHSLAARPGTPAGSLSVPHPGFEPGTSWVWARRLCQVGLEGHASDRPDSNRRCNLGKVAC
jgi:hypothetical protein